MHITSHSSGQRYALPLNSSVIVHPLNPARDTSVYKVRVTKSVCNIEMKEARYLLSEEVARKCEYDAELRNRLNPDKVKYVMYYYDIEIDFVPFVGLSIFNGAWSSGELLSITWDNEKKLFLCRVADEYPHQAFDTYIDETHLHEMCEVHEWIKIGK